MTVVVDGERPIPFVIDTLAHEAGHLRQDLVNPDQHQAALFSSLVLALLEAEAQQFQRAFWLTIEEFTGETFLEYPDMDVFRRFIAQRAFSWFRAAEQEEHALGYILQWALLLTVPDLAPLAAELEENGSLSAESSLELYGLPRGPFAGRGGGAGAGHVQKGELRRLGRTVQPNCLRRVGAAVARSSPRR